MPDARVSGGGLPQKRYGPGVAFLTAKELETGELNDDWFTVRATASVPIPESVAVAWGLTKAEEPQ
jgi:hypothetical protein